MIAAALDCDVARRSVFARKNYFYPDLPKGYQISQYDEPIASQRHASASVRIHRAHLEEDAAKLNPRRGVGAHPRLRRLAGGLQPRRHAAGRDRHRARHPLPGAGPRVGAAARTTISQLGVSDVNMEEGSLRVDGNISIRPAGSDELGTKTELKNMNSFRFLERGSRPRSRGSGRCWRAGRRSPRRPSTSTPRTARSPRCARRSTRTTIATSRSPTWSRWCRPRQMLKEARESLPELPADQRRERYVTEIGLSEDARDTLAFDAEFGEYFERAVAAGRRRTPPRRSPTGSPASWSPRCARPTPRTDPLASKATPEAVAALAGLVEDKTISHGAGKQVLAKLVEEGGDPGGDRGGGGPRPDLGLLASSRGSSSARSRPSPRPPSRSARATRRRSAGSSAR